MALYFSCSSTSSTKSQTSFKTSFNQFLVSRHLSEGLLELLHDGLVLLLHQLILQPVHLLLQLLHRLLSELSASLGLLELGGQGLDLLLVGLLPLFGLLLSNLE